MEVNKGVAPIGGLACPNLRRESAKSFEFEHLAGSQMPA